MTDVRRTGLRLIEGQAQRDSAVASDPALARRIEALLQQPGAVAQLTPLELHQLTRRAGPLDSLPLLELARPEQVRDVVDLQIWRDAENADLPLLLDWLAALTQLSDGAFQRHYRALDVELIALLLVRHTRVILLQEDDPPGEPEGRFLATPDGWFVLDLLGENEAQNDQLAALIEAMYQEDADDARRLLHNVIAELPTELEQTAARWRRGRMEDLGFSDPGEALRIYAYLDPAQVSVEHDGTADQPLRADPEPAGRAEVATVIPPDPACFWNRALAELDDPDERARLGNALVALSNLNLAADRVDPADLERVGRTLEHLRGRLSLGLEQLCDGEPSRAPAALRQVALMRVARLGHSLVLQQQRRLLPLLRAAQPAQGSDPIGLLDARWHEAIAALLATPALHAPVGAPRRPFAARGEVATLAAAIDELAVAFRLVPLALRPTPLPPVATLGSLFTTAAVNHALGREGALDRAALHALRDRLTATSAPDAALFAAARAVAATRLAEDPSPTALALIDDWLTALHRELSTLTDLAVDPRFVKRVWVATELR